MTGELSHRPSAICCNPVRSAECEKNKADPIECDETRVGACRLVIIFIMKSE